MSFFIPRRHGLTAVMLLILLQFSTVSNAQVRMRANLMIVDNNGTTLMDANMTNYNAAYSNLIDGHDIWKMSNFSENFGIIRQNANLAIERRSVINGTDTTYFRMWNMRQFHYRIQVIAERLEQNNMYGFIRDHYLNQDTPISLNDTTDVDFYVTAIAGSYAQNRFSLIYVTNSFAALPVTFTGIQASKKGAQVQVAWQADSEVSMDKYVVERSFDGYKFVEIAAQKANNIPGKQHYEIKDFQLSEANVYYRIKGLSNSGKIQYSAMAHLGIGVKETISVYPNPVANKQFTLTLNSIQQATYIVKIFTADGQLVSQASGLKKAGESRVVHHLPANIAPGMYQVQVALAGQEPVTKTILVQ